jgi:hypothetical protein
LKAILKRATGYFLQATQLDSGNVDAKENLELVLRISQPKPGSFNKDARSGYGFGRGRGATPIGNGY